jgi:hypothetical protein
MDQEKTFGDIEFSGKDVATPSFPFDRLAISGRGELLLVSLVAPAMNVKQIRAILSGGAKVICNAGGVKVNQPSREDWYAHAPGRLTSSADGYFCHVHRLDYCLCHALYVTKMPGFMRVVTEEALWQELNDTRFTTPLLREWVPYIQEELRLAELLEEAHVFNCTCGVLSAQTKHLDEIVSEGLRSGAIHIPSSSAA